MWRMLTSALMFLCVRLIVGGDPHHEPTDYCDLLAQDDINGVKHGFMAGNNVYYIGGRLGSWDNDHETVGLTHPFFHDLRSRGTGIVYHEGVGTGNDFYGWEFWKDVKVAWGTIVTEDNVWENPAPTKMLWGPDKMIVEYALTNPYLSGEQAGWCSDWKEGSSLGDSHWVDLDKEDCWQHCRADPACFQAVYEVRTDTSSHPTRCWIGLNKMTDLPGPSRPDSNDTCYAKPLSIEPVYVREEKFISRTDVVTTSIMSDKPVTLLISGQSFQNKRSVSMNGSCVHEETTNSIQVTENGRVIAKVSERPVIEKEAALMYSGLTGVLSSSLPLENVQLEEISPGLCGYTFSLPLDSDGLDLSWTMAEDKQEAVRAVQEVLADTIKFRREKTDRMNDMLNNLVPYFRCSDEDVVKVYYFLWSLHLMYYKDPAQGMRSMSTTQTAVNNFLGLHRYDAVFQILVGSWVNPQYHDYFANGNVLSWADTMPYRREDTLPDNFGVSWVSGVYGASTIAHVQGAWQVYQHSGNKTFLEKSYQFYKDLFWDGIGGKHWLYAYDSVLCLNKMANILGYTEDPAHWNETVNFPHLLETMEHGWQLETEGMYGSTSGGIGFSNVAPAANSLFPRDWVKIMAEEWLDNPEKGFYGDVPLTRNALQDWVENENDNFAVVPDGNWYSIRPLYIHTLDRLANNFTLAHLKTYNMEGGVPVAPEGRDSNYSMSGDKYSNFNAGKILLVLEGIGGLKYSLEEDSFIFAENLPVEWSFMEFDVPVVSERQEVEWVNCRVERESLSSQRIFKSVTVTNNPFTNLVVRPWLEERQVESFSPDGEWVEESPPPGHMGWHFQENSVEIALTLH